MVVKDLVMQVTLKGVMKGFGQPRIGAVARKASFGMAGWPLSGTVTLITYMYI